MTSVLFLALFAMAFRVAIMPDSWWHLRAGQYIIENRELLTWDPFSYTRYGELWLYPGGVVQAAMYIFFNALGPGGMSLWTAVIVTAAFWFIYQSLSKQNLFFIVSLVLLAAVASAVFWTARPFLITFLLTSVFVYILERYRKNLKDHLWWMPLIMLLWANGHGGFIIGFFVWGAYLLEEMVAWVSDFRARDEKLKIVFDRSGLQTFLSGRAGKMVLVGLLMLLVVPINPAGPIILLYFFATFDVGAAWEFIAEWQSPDFHVAAIQPFLILILLTILVFGASRQRSPLSHLVLSVLFLYMALLSGRNIALFALVAPVFIAPHLDEILRNLREKWSFPSLSFSDPVPTGPKKVLNYLLFGLVIIGVVLKIATVFPFQAQQEIFRQLYPVDAVEFIQDQQLEGRMMNSYNWGGYLQMHLPQHPVYADGRADLYGDEIVGEWLQFVGAEDNWQSILDKWEVNFIILEPHWPVIAQLEDAGWNQIYSDEIVVVYQR
ncbi:MAG: hypothetical protein DWQ07_06950 [Chloroflexi bacterium]|nr:MAG: hypothetical protein DWQ07_06950 [Chloroflexota bacterium]MBL1195561.1 hypothetical protein [Chloroflexota bacterium]NOH12844.1 hypothetical protein [Chloroflexota bacterium]